MDGREQLDCNADDNGVGSEGQVESGAKEVDEGTGLVERTMR